MASSAVIGALRVVLGVDTATFETGMKGAAKHLESFASAVNKSAAVLGGVLAGAVAGLGVAVKKAINHADELGKTAQKIGVPVEELSALQHAADLSGISIEQLSTGIGKLSKNMVEAAAKPTSEAALAFEALGIKVTDATGKIKPTTEILSDVAEAFAGIKDGAGKTAVAMAIFGKAGKEMIPLLNSGKDGLKEMTDEAAKLGIVIDTKTAKSAEAFNDNLTRLGKVKDAIIIKIMEGMLPSLEHLSAAFVQVAKDGDALKSIGKSIGGFFDTIALEVEKTKLSMETSAKERAAFVKAINAPLFTSEGKQAWLDYFATLDESKKRMSDLVNGIDTFAKRFDAAAGSIKPLKDAQKEFNFNALAGKSALDKFLESQAKSIAVQQAELKTVGQAAGAKEALKVKLEAYAIAAADGTKVTDVLKKKIDETSTSAGNMALKLEGMALVQQNLSPLQAYNQEMANTEKAMKAVGATQEQIIRAQDKIKDKFGESAEAIGLAMGNIAGSVSSLLGTLGKENKAMGIASKAFGIAQVIINTQIAITKALATLGPIGGPIAAAVMAAQGAASIATIAAQSFAGGGSFKVAGGISGTDNKFVPLNLASGEMVDIKSAAQSTTTTTAGGAGGVQQITIRGRRWSDLLTLEDLRDLTEAMNSANRDGYRLKFAAA